MSTRRFRIALSFAGEKRDFVAEVAAILARRFGETAILYDKFHEAEFAVYDLGLRLPILYGEQSDLIVPVLCPDYDEKRWTGWEWLHIYSLLTKADGHRVMPCRFQHANADGLSAAAAFIELDEKTAEQAAKLILERLAINEGNPKDHYTKSASVSASDRPAKTSTPNNLPRLQPFFGRATELATLREALDPDSRTWGALIDGPGGMGKTSLAVRAAYDCPPGLFQRIVFVSVKDREMDDDGERPLGNLLVPGFLEMLNELARELGQPDIAKSPEDQRIRLLLDALRPAQALLLLDNLESLPKTDRDQLFTFVKRLPPGCKAILTSRRRIGSGSEELILEKLDQDAALATLADLADLARRNPLLARTSEAERIALYTQTAGKPLLLRWVAGQLGRGSCRTFADALAFLRTCPPDNDPLEFIFGDLAKEFTAEEEKVLCALTYFSLPAKVEHIAKVAGIENVPTEIALRTLANRSLVVPDQEETHYSLVPLVAEFVRRYRPEAVSEAGSRLEQRAFALILESGVDKQDRFRSVAAAWPFISASLPLFIAGSNDRLQRVSVALQQPLRSAGRWDEQLALSMEAEKAASAVEDYKSAGYQAYNVGAFHMTRGRSEDVFVWAARATSHFNKAGSHPFHLAMATQLRGLGHSSQGDHAAAIIDFRKSLEVFEHYMRASPLFVEVMGCLGSAESEAGDLEAAQVHYEKALDVAREIDDDKCVATILGMMASLSLKRADWREAESKARKALYLSENGPDCELVATNCHRLATAVRRQGRPADALPYIKRAVDIFAQLCSPALEAARETLRDCEE